MSRIRACCDCGCTTTLMAHAIAYRETGNRPGDDALAFPRAVASRVGADRSAAVGPLQGGAAGPAASRRFRGPPRHPYTADWFADVIAGFCQRGGRAASAARRARHRRGACAARGHDRPDRALAPGADVQSPAPPRGVRREASHMAGRAPVGRAAGARPAAVSTAPRSCSGPPSANGCRFSAIRRRAI